MGLPSQLMRRGRRSFLRGAGGLAMGLPLLPSLVPEAAAAGGAQRMVVFFSPMGMLMDSWNPAQSGTNFTLSEILQPLASVQDDVVVISGLDNRAHNLNSSAGGHFAAPQTLLTGMPLADNLNPDGTLVPGTPAQGGDAGGPSIEQVIASRLDAPTQYRSLDHGIGNAESAWVDLFYAGASDPIGAEHDPVAAFDRLFFDLDVQDPTPLQRLRAARGSVLDAVGGEYERLGARVGTEDRARLDAHAGKIRELEARLGNTGIPGAGCQEPQYTLPPGYQFSDQVGTYDDVTARAMLDITAMALACDLTRVATVKFTTNHLATFPWLGQQIPHPGYDNWHDMIHLARNDADGRPKLVASMQFYAEMFTTFVETLRSTADGDGSLLDSTLVLWVTEFGGVQGQNTHATLNLPVVLAGNLCGALETGRHLDFRGQDRTMNDLMVAILNLYGYDDTSFGWPDLNNGALSLA